MARSSLVVAPVSPPSALSLRRLRAVSRARRALPRVWLGLALVACGTPEAGPLALSHVAQPIFGGALDTEHPEVMLLASRRGFSCTGTVVHAERGTGFLLTAAHCVTDDGGAALPAEDFVVVPGDDFAESSAAFSVASVSVEPSYDGSFAANDLAVVRFVTGGAALASIPVLGAAEDTLDVGDALVLVGYGQTEANESNTRRRRVSRQIEELDEQLIVYSQADARGACFGDSGGPVLAQVGGEERVAAVISGGVSDAGEGCGGGIGVAIRASGYDAFIRGALGAAASG